MSRLCGIAGPWNQQRAVPSGHGECYLTLSSGNLLLQGVGLSRMLVNGSQVRLPVAGITLSAAGNAGSTLYYIYLSPSMTMEKSTTAPVAAPLTGVLLKGGDATRSYVGMAMSTPAGAWADSEKQRLVNSHYNPRPRGLLSVISSDRTVPGTTPTNITDTGEVVEFITHTIIPPGLGAFATLGNDSIGYTSIARLALDNVGITSRMIACRFSSITEYATQALPQAAVNVSSGYHYVHLQAYAPGGGTAHAYAGLTGIVGHVWG